MDFDLACSGAFHDELAAHTVAAEEMGVSGVWTAETRYDSLIASAVMASASREIQFGTAITVAFSRSPMVMAQAAWDLARIGHGRFVLGLGTQVKAHIERRFSMPFSHPAARIREYILALRTIWKSFQNESKLGFEGEFYRFSLMTDFFKPEPIEHPDIPIYLAGVNRRLARVAGEVCEGFHVHPLHSRSYLDDVILPEIRAGAEAAGRRAEDVVLAVPVFTIVDDGDEDLERQRNAVRRQIGFYGSTPTYGNVFAQHGWDDTGEKLSGLMRAGDLAGMTATISDDMLDEFAVTTSWSGLAPALLDRFRGLNVRVYPYTTSPSWSSGAKRERWEEVIAAVRAG